MMEQVVVDTGRNPRHAVVWLHGLGADGHDFEPIVPQLSAASTRAVRFVFPHAPVRPVTVNGGLPMRAWYDILGVDIDRNQDAAGIAASVAAVDALLDEQLAAGIEPDRIILAGFSQGGAIALRCGLARSSALGGVVGLSTYLLGADSLAGWANGNEMPPVFMGHGTQDPIVPAALGESSARHLEEAGYVVQWQTWPMAHSVCAEEIAALDAWLDARWS
ncbi:MAG TPA: alpha/beta fold hydrolase [Wenzhouxiangella sp.]|nr:alpha/beta fold hydrolase [Wenzhouxiangella sp.]